MQVTHRADLKNLNILADIPSAIYLHEYIHFLQDITTTYGFTNISTVVDYIKYVNDVARAGTSRTFKVPVKLRPSPSHNVYSNDKLNTVWLTQDQMSRLFGKAKSTINEHIKNIYTENELVEEEFNRKFGISEFADKPTNFYSLDVIISVGYRVKSTQGTKFRIWANKILKDYLVKGYSVNEKRLQEQKEQWEQFKRTVKLLGNVINSQSLSSDEATSLKGHH